MSALLPCGLAFIGLMIAGTYFLWKQERKHRRAEPHEAPLAPEVEAPPRAAIFIITNRGIHEIQ